MNDNLTPTLLSDREAERWYEPMKLAYETARWSKDPSTQNGAVLLDWSGKTMVWAENHFPSNTPKEFWDDREMKYAHVVHAEMAAILAAAAYNEGTYGATLVAPWAACSNCAKHIVAAEIAQLVRHPNVDPATNAAQQRWHEDILLGDAIMLRAGVKILEIPPLPRSVGQFLKGGELWP